MQVVGEQRGDYVRDKGMQAAENLLEAHPDANLIYGENEEMGQGGEQAVEARNLKSWDGTSGIMTIGADGLKSGYESIRKGKLTATVDVGPVDMGREFIMAIFMHEVLGYSVDKVINVPTQVIDKSNVDVVEAYTDWALGTTYP
jgi:ribose transport system substrate-binding protein